MKTYILLLLMSPVLGSAYSQTNFNAHYQRGYYKKNGTYVHGYMKTNPNGTNKDNYSTKSNTNPYTDDKGYRAEDYSSEARNYGKGKTIFKGSNGGEYYLNKNNHKIYVPKR